jgi:tubulin-specific chaperone A
VWMNISVVCVRSFQKSLLKEGSYYEKEVQENEEKLAKMKEENRDPYDIKKFEEVLGESYMMIPDSRGRLERALEDLVSYVESEEVVNNHQHGEWFEKAQQLLLTEQERIKKIADPDAPATPLDNLKEGEAF